MIKDYNPTGVKQTDFTDPHGNVGYNVFFEGEDKPVFMMAKRAPEVGTPEYGEIVDTPKKSGDGTYRKFVRKQREEAAPSQTTPDIPKPVASWDRDEAITRQSALKSAVATGEKDPKKIFDLAEEFYLWLGGSGIDVPDDKEEVPLPEPQGEKITIDADEEIDLSDVPF